MSNELQAIKAIIRDVPDFPKEGITFKDIAPLLGNGELFRATISLMAERIQSSGATKIAGLDARGFIFGGAIADRLGIGFVPLRKAGKLPYETRSVSYDLEYGSNTIEMHVDAVESGEKVAIVDDLLATGGTATAAKELISGAGAQLVGAYFCIELAFLNGRTALGDTPVDSLITY